jgi:hypothetical protein
VREYSRSTTSIYTFLVAEIPKEQTRQDGWLDCAVLLDLEEPSGEL